jgi:hypothetical protein
MNIFRRLYMLIRGETPVMWTCPACGKKFDLRFSEEHVKTHMRGG